MLQYYRVFCPLPPLITTCTVSCHCNTHNSCKRAVQYKKLSSNMQSDSPLTSDTSATTSPEPSGYTMAVPPLSTAAALDARHDNDSNSSSSSSSMGSVQPMSVGRSGPVQKAVVRSQRLLHRHNQRSSKPEAHISAQHSSALREASRSGVTAARDASSGHVAQPQVSIQQITQ
jgi:hypothetical protein